MSAQRLLVVALVAAVALAGCSGKKKEAAPVVLPDEITEQDIERIGNLASKFPTQFSFPGQELLEPVLHWINGTLQPGTGSGGIELPNDDGPVDYNGDVIVFDVSDKVPVGQPVEVRINLKYWGDPGRSADADIWVDMPGSHGALNPEQYDESINWNIVNKARVVDSVHLEGQPFAVGLQVNNGKILDPSGGVPYAMAVEFNFAKDVLAPGAAYAITVPDNATGLVFKTDRVTGDEHVDVSFLLIGPDDKLVRHLQHNDIGVDTLFLPVKQGGEYVVYSHSMHGGFVRLESEVPNEHFMARLLTTTEAETVLHSDVPAPGTYAESGVAGNTWGAEGTFDVAGFPLDIVPFIRSTAGSVNAAINVTSSAGWVATAFTCNWVDDQAPPYCAGFQDDSGRVGSEVDVRTDRSHLAPGAYTYGVVAENAGVQLGVTILSYTR
jgi:hypothetical protein